MGMLIKVEGSSAERATKYWAQTASRRSGGSEFDGRRLVAVGLEVGSKRPSVQARPGGPGGLKLATTYL
jgi:hypothetical protein